ncbi:MAG: Vitamin B12 dependent methionine synthase activation subunit [Clostridia bacterium]|nr:Vitamin B12 dependent methionine synthase activation subunit [Clostridia bacterium]
MTNFKNYAAPPVNKKEILRYAGAKDGRDLPAGLLEDVLAEAEGSVEYKVCWSFTSVKTGDGICRFDTFFAPSADLCKCLAGCDRAIIFAATAGVGVDRLISKYGRVSPLKALLFQALGAERIEALCDTFCEDISKSEGVMLTPRFSPGYGDFDISYQKDIFALLDCRKYIGLTLSGSMLMTPSKSVTAIAGLTEAAGEKTGKCDLCGNKDCAYRGNI